MEYLNRFYEQQDIKKATLKKMALVLGNYVKRNLSWCNTDLGTLIINRFYV